ncbi:protein ANTI-SILENCING 1 isoform X2 [Vigna radiata var. radiata]|uniref:Protein ANTI-SILENCING 1 isoform X2 n=1 Tax=Vigna radiata var. radiata TaxID=3916 RepID=A0A1S3U5T4_VIGRR|nr:protein ANTI-SILENCING 1 isoform X2 [Vigna radiata var. radiata]
MVEAGEEVIEFKWGNMRSVGGRKKDVRFYDSFFYDGVEYSLFDSVFLYKEGEPEHYIGKIVKIWETSDKNKRVKVLWYFRPSEIGNFLEGNDALENELFLASGEGEGLANVNPLEAIAGKCNIVCISKDSRNPYPSDAEVKMAEFVFYRFFDVGKCKILDKIDDKIAGIEVKNIFNHLDSRKHVGIGKPGLEKKEVSGNFMACNEAVAPLSQNNNQPLIEKPDGKCFDALARENAVSKSLLGKKPTLRTGVKEASELNDSYLVSNNKNAPQDKVEENGGHKASLVKQKSFSKLSHASRTDLKMREMAKMDYGRGNDSIEKNISTSRVNLGKDDHEDEGVSVGQFNKGVVEEMTSKKENRGGFGKVSSAKMNNNGKSRKLITYDDDDDNDDNVKTVAPSSSKDKYKLQREANSFDVEELPSKRLKIDKATKLASDKLCKDSSVISSNVEHERDFRLMEVTRRPDDDRSKWFKEIPWEEKLKTAFEQRKLVLLQNLDPSLSSSEVQNIIWTGFKERCTAKVKLLLYLRKWKQQQRLLKN